MASFRKMFNLDKEDDIRKYVIRRELPSKKEGKVNTKAPKIQRLVTPLTLQRKRHLKQQKLKNAEKSLLAKQEYEKLLQLRHKERKEKKQSLIQKRRLSSHKATTA